MAEMLYRQVVLMRHHGEGKTTTLVTTLPEKHRGVLLIPGMKVRLIDNKTDAPEEDTWEVFQVSRYAVTERVAKDRAHNWERMRKASDA